MNIVNKIVSVDVCNIKGKLYAKQKHLGCKKVQGQAKVTCKQAGVTKSFDIS